MSHRFIKILLTSSCPLFLVVCLCPLPACKKPTEPKAVPPDTTSHDFVFEIDTLGNGSSSVLNDVCIIDENNIWAVGEIYVPDSTGQSEEIYNAVHWDGKKWNLKKVPVRDLGGFTFYTALKAVIGFSPNDVWVAGDADLIHWNGSFWSGKALFITDLSFNGQVLKMWGTSGSNIYCVGRNGAIYHFDGSNWQKLSSGTTVDIQDIWGEGQTVLAVASLVNYGRGLDLLQIHGSPVTKLDTSGLRIAESSIWFQAGKVYYIGGDGLFRKNSLAGQKWSFDTYQPTTYIDRVRGNSSNDVFVCGSFGFLAHFNGAMWKDYTGIEAPEFYSRYKGLSVKGNMIVAVGWLNDQAVILKGKRQ